jgi:hypothetical protein
VGWFWFFVPFCFFMNAASLSLFICTSYMYEPITSHRIYEELTGYRTTKHDSE